MNDVIPTRSAYLELREDRQGMQEGYRFLDEKRLVLAGELIAQLATYKEAKQRFDALHRQAIATLQTALERHGLEELGFYPALRTPQVRIRTRQRQVLGVLLQQAELQTGEIEHPPAALPSPEAEHCRQLFLQLLEEATRFAAHSANLQRLWDEYATTSRRARALEDVLLPEIDATLASIDTALEEQDREEAIRVRHFTRGYE